ncbi:unnamed protein product [Arctogadus glacialis]
MGKTFQKGPVYAATGPLTQSPNPGPHPSTLLTGLITDQFVPHRFNVMPSVRLAGTGPVCQEICSLQKRLNLAPQPRPGGRFRAWRQTDTIALRLQRAARYATHKLI